MQALVKILPQDVVAAFPDAGLEAYPTGDVLEAARAAVLDAIAALRWQAISTGFVFAGAPLALDDRTQGRIANAVAGLERLPAAATVEWEVSRGVFATFDLSTLQALGAAAFSHVQACFAASRPMMEAAVAAADLDTLAAIDLETGWPS